MPTTDSALGILALLLLGALPLAAQERAGDGPTVVSPDSADEPRCDVVLYTLEEEADSAGLLLPDEDRSAEAGPHRGERVLAIPVQEEPIPLWAELAPLPDGPTPAARRARPPRVEAEPRSGIEVVQVMRVEAAGADPTGLAGEREDKRIPELDPPVSVERDDGEGLASAVIVRLDTSRAVEGRWWLVVGDEAFWCAGSVHVVRTDAPLEDAESIEPAAGGFPPRAAPGVRPRP